MKNKSGATSDFGTQRPGCEITFNIDCKGDVNIYNCCTPPGKDDDSDGSEPPPCDIANGGCIPFVAAAKPKPRL